MNKTKKNKKPNPKKRQKSTSKIQVSILGVIIGIGILSTVIFIHQFLARQNPFNWQYYILPVILGSVAGFFAASLIFDMKRKLVIRTVNAEKAKKAADLKTQSIVTAYEQLKEKYKTESITRRKAQEQMRRMEDQMKPSLSASTDEAYIGKVLVVDDEASILNTINAELYQSDILVVTAHSGDEGLEKLEQESFDMVISDYKMPEMSGAEFLRQVRATDSTISRVILSDYDEQPSALKVITDGLATAVFSKPQEDSVQSLRDGVTRMLKIRKILKSQKLLSLMNKIDSIPSLPTLYNEFIDAVHRESRYDTLAEIINHDAGAATKLLQISNSAFFGGEKTASVEQALLFLGINAAKDLVLASALESENKLSESQQSYLQDIMTHSTIVNKYIGPFYQILYGKQLNSNFKSVGITHDIGKILLLQHFPERFRSIVANMHSNGISFYESELELGFMGTTHAELGAYLLDMWNFPEISIEVALYHHTLDKEDFENEYNDIIRATMLTNELVNYIGKVKNIEELDMNAFLVNIKKDVGAIRI